MEQAYYLSFHALTFDFWYYQHNNGQKYIDLFSFGNSFYIRYYAK
jgi:hypothetical protein